ncbi:hypothetical protein HU200_063714 [Digitaria exilis]|uniref:Defensin n=1 Tax=Digitaria exilis TaxID=1010633 RepID=A0A835A139_9POAL|nr:hypothetical protein HU200_063714 [Digitaria exilis]CAB3489991.1 unnamed protein product [Digitaria exilis]
MTLIKMSRMRHVPLMVSLFLLLATMTSTSQSVKIEGCFGSWCRPRRPPRPITCFVPRSLEQYNDYDCTHTCNTQGHHFGGYCKLEVLLCCCR